MMLSCRKFSEAATPADLPSKRGEIRAGDQFKKRQANRPHDAAERVGAADKVIK
jgi:hypothetical protein